MTKVFRCNNKKCGDVVHTDNPLEQCSCGGKYKQVSPVDQLTPIKEDKS